MCPGLAMPGGIGQAFRRDGVDACRPGLADMPAQLLHPMHSGSPAAGDPGGTAVPMPVPACMTGG